MVLVMSSSIAALSMDTPALDEDASARQGRVLLTIESFKVSRWACPQGSRLTARSLQNTKSIVGWSIGWVSGVLYFTSRIPQIVKNVSLAPLGVLSQSITLVAFSSGASQPRGSQSPCLSWPLLAIRPMPWESCSL